MNALIVGTNKQTVLDHLPDTFLLIDDGDLINAITLPPRRAVTRFDVSTHSFNPLKDIDHRRARELAAVLYAAFPQGENTLTVRNGKRALARLMLDADRLDRISGDRKNPAIDEALATVEDVLFSDVLKNVLTRPTNLSFKGTILARLDRAELGDFDCFVLGNLLISQYAGQVIVPDFGFYAHSGHTSLIRQQRLIAGINSFAEVPSLEHQLLLIDNKNASHSTAEDGKVLALYAGLLPGTNAYNDFIARCIA